MCVCACVCVCVCDSPGAAPLYKNILVQPPSPFHGSLVPAALPSSATVGEKWKALEVGLLQTSQAHRPAFLCYPSPGWQRMALFALFNYRSSRGSCYLLRYDHGLCHFTRMQPKNRTGGRVKSSFVALWTSGTCVSRQQGLTPKTLCPKFLVWRKLPDHLWDLRVITSRSCTCPPSWSPIVHVHILQCFCWLCHLNCVTVSLNGSVDVAAHVWCLYKYTVPSTEVHYSIVNKCYLENVYRCKLFRVLLNWIQHDANTLTSMKSVFIKVCRLFLYWQWLWLSTVLGSYARITAFWNPWLFLKQLWLKFWLLSHDY